jgi:hypothetical protein
MYEVPRTVIDVCAKTVHDNNPIIKYNFFIVVIGLCFGNLTKEFKIINKNKEKKK